MNTDETIAFAKSGIDERQTKKQLIKIVLGTGIFIPFPLVLGIIAGDISMIFGIIMTLAYIASTAATVNILKDGLTVKKRITANIVGCAEIVIQFTMLGHYLHFVLIGPSIAVALIMYLPIIILPIIVIVYMRKRLENGPPFNIKKQTGAAVGISFAAGMSTFAAGRALSRILGGKASLILIVAMVVFLTSFFSARIGMQITRMRCISKLEEAGYDMT